MPPDSRPLLRPSPRFVLHQLADLAGDLATLDLDEIDGEFYWRCCRWDLCKPILQHRGANVPRPWTSEHPAPPAFEYLREGFDRALGFVGLHAEVSRLYPGAVFERLYHGRRVSMRASEAAGEENDDYRAHSVRVYSGAWLGEDVERAFAEHFDEAFEREGDRRFVADPDRPGHRERRALARREARWFRLPADEVGARRPAPVVSLELRVDFKLVTEPPTEWPHTERHARVPFVEVRVRRPPPPPGVVARQYDTVVREQQRWHLALPGAGGRQDKAVALRTWAVGLLVARGERFADAMRLAAEGAGVPEVSQSRFGQDRQRLLERVPEARVYLYARDEVPAALAKGDPTADPSQP